MVRLTEALRRYLRRRNYIKRRSTKAGYKPVFSSGRRAIDAIEDRTATVYRRQA